MKVKFLQEGGPMGQQDPAMAGGAPQEQAMDNSMQQEQDDEQAMKQQLYQMAQEIVQQMGPEVAMMLAQAIVEIVQGGQGGGQEEMPAPEQQPVYRKGGQLVYGRR